MLAVASKRRGSNKKIYHKQGCIYANRIQPDNLSKMNADQAEKRLYHECKYCGGLQGDIRVHKKAIEKWSRKYHMEFVFYKDTETLYIQTDIGFWKVYLKQELGRYLLYHRNTYSKGMELKDAITGAFHRQGDVRATDSLEFIVEYIIAHDRAKVIMMDDYRKLPRSSRKQKRYFEAAKKKKRREEILRVDAILADLEKERMNVMG